MGCCELPFPLAFCCRTPLCPTAMGPPRHRSFLSLMFKPCPPTIFQCLESLFPTPIPHLTVHRILFTPSSTTFFYLHTSLSNSISILNPIFLYLISVLFLSNRNSFLSWKYYLFYQIMPLQIMEKGQMEDISTRISLIFLHIRVKEKLYLYQLLSY